MHKVMIAGAGKIGSMIAYLLADTKDYQIHLADLAFTQTKAMELLKKIDHVKTVALDVTEHDSIKRYIKNNGITAIISSLPFYLNPALAKVAKESHVHYFDLTEDTAVTKAIKELAEDAETAFIPQCGLAPGFINIVANSLMQTFDECHHAKLRVGALPQRANNALHYSLTWSTDGIINQYGNACMAIENSQPTSLAPLEGLESIHIDGCIYEAFNTSGGLGSLAEIHKGKVKSLNYKTIRYPGHCEKIRFLMNDLKLNQNRKTLKHILEAAIPKTDQDLVIVYVSADGVKDGVFIEKSYIKKIYPLSKDGLTWSAIQISTASGVCAVVDLVLNKTSQYQGLVLQENFHFSKILSNRFASCFD